MAQLDSIRPLDMKRLSVRNHHVSKENDKKILELRKISNSVLHACDKDIQEMRGKFGRLQTAARSPTQSDMSGSIRTSRSNSLKSDRRPQSKSVTEFPAPPTRSVTSGSIKVRKSVSKSPSLSGGESGEAGRSFPRGGTSRSSTGGSVKKRSGSLKSRRSEIEAPNTGVERKVSHSYCEAVVHREEGGVDRIVPGGPRMRSTSMFETGPLVLSHQSSIPETDHDESVDEGAPAVVRVGEEGTRPMVTITVEESGEIKTNMTLDEAVLSMGVDCPYKDLI